MANTKVFKRTQDVNHIRATMEALNISATALSDQLGTSSGSVSTWLTKGDAPYWTLLSCKYLRASDTLPSATVIMAITKTDNEKMALKALLDALKLKYVERDIS